MTKKSKITKILNSKENSKRKVPNQKAKSKVQTHQQMDNNCHIPDLVHSVSYVSEIVQKTENTQTFCLCVSN